MTYTINFGDGTTGALSQGSCIGVTAIVGGQGGIQCSGSASHIYSAAGSDSATLSNALGLTVGTVAITVTGAVPHVSFTPTSPSTPRAGIEYDRIDPSGGIAPPNQATTLGLQAIPALLDATQNIPRSDVPFSGSNAALPTIASFTASPASIAPFAGGRSATLSWSVASATSLSVSGLGAVIGNSIQVSPSQTTTYTLTASNAQGSVTAQTTVTVAGYH
jgi:PKD repeat protein